MISGLIITVQNLTDFQGDWWFYRSIQVPCLSDGRFEVVYSSSLQPIVIWSLFFWTAEMDLLTYLLSK